MVMHAEAPILTEDQRARSEHLAVFLSQAVELSVIESCRRDAVSAAELIRKGSPFSASLDEVLNTAVNELGETIMATDQDLSITISHTAIGLSRARVLLKDYGLEGVDEPTIVVPSERITAANGLAFRQSRTTPRPVLDLRIQSSEDRPLTTYVYESGRRNLEEIPNPGRWHRFPLDMIIVGLISA